MLLNVGDKFRVGVSWLSRHSLKKCISLSVFLSFIYLSNSSFFYLVYFLTILVSPVYFLLYLPALPYLTFFPLCLACFCLTMFPVSRLAQVSSSVN